MTPTTTAMERAEEEASPIAAQGEEGEATGARGQGEGRQAAEGGEFHSCFFSLYMSLVGSLSLIMIMIMIMYLLLRLAFTPCLLCSLFYFSFVAVAAVGPWPRDEAGG